jgi:hypothetical protein
MKSGYEPVIVLPSDTMQIIEALVNPLHRILLLLIACTGLRASEALALRWGDIRKWTDSRGSSVVGCKLGRTENSTFQSPCCMPFDTAPFLE